MTSNGRLGLYTVLQLVATLAIANVLLTPYNRLPGVRLDSTGTPAATDQGNRLLRSYVDKVYLERVLAMA